MWDRVVVYVREGIPLIIQGKASYQRDACVYDHEALIEASGRARNLARERRAP